MLAACSAFQSTPACERATRAKLRSSAPGGGFNPRPRASGRPWAALFPAWRRARFNPRPRASGRLSRALRLSRSRPFQSTPACERATTAAYSAASNYSFQSTPACERATRHIDAHVAADRVSIHARVRAGDLATSASFTTPPSFQSAPACERATKELLWHRDAGRVSGHARVRAGDLPSAWPKGTVRSFNPRPRASGRPGTEGDPMMLLSFQSTPACERATERWQAVAKGHWFQSTPACERATSSKWRRPLSRLVSIHARVRAGDAGPWPRAGFVSFQSTPACERATATFRACDRAGSRFNPRPRASGRLVPCNVATTRDNSFNPRPRASGRLPDPRDQLTVRAVSIHARVRAGDMTLMPPRWQPESFNPRPRASGRPWLRYSSQKPSRFQSTPACERATFEPALNAESTKVSIHARVRAGDHRGQA